MKKPFFGGCLSFTKEVYEQINRYPNNYYGWGGEDDELGLRIFKENITAYKNKKGKVIDIEEYKENVIVDIQEKINLVEQDDNKNLEKWEKISNYNNYKNNGLNNLKYDILYGNDSPDAIHIIVDLMKSYDVEYFPNDYDIPEVTKKQYHTIIKQIIYTCWWSGRH